jgi:hypothetical protein
VVRDAVVMKVVILIRNTWIRRNQDLVRN